MTFSLMFKNRVGRVIFYPPFERHIRITQRTYRKQSTVIWELPSLLYLRQSTNNFKWKSCIILNDICHHINEKF